VLGQMTFKTIIEYGPIASARLSGKLFADVLPITDNRQLENSNVVLLTS